jgi:hypothetical protein
MAELAAGKSARPVTFELSIINVDKPPLDFIEIDERLRQFGNQPVVLTRAATFVEKAALFPGCTFIVGVDTITRIGDQRYYGGDAERRDSALQILADAGCRFIVFGRAVDGRFCTLTDLNLPKALYDLCEEVPETEFRSDTSSTLHRAAHRR